MLKWKRILIALAIVWALVATTATFIGPAHGQAVCGVGYDTQVEFLANEFDEHLRFRGIMSTGVVVELFVANDGTTYTVLILQPDGTMCVVNSGFDAEFFKGIVGEGA